MHLSRLLSSRCALSANNANCLAPLKDWVRTWSFIGARAQSAIKCHDGLLTSLQSITCMSQELLTGGFSFVCTSRFNQDCLENFFASLRARQGWNENPTAAQFQSAFRSLVVLSSFDSCTSGKNCVNDEDVTLLNPAEVGTDLAASVGLGLDSLPCDSRAGDLSLGDNVRPSDSVWSEISQEILNSDVCYEHAVVEIFTEAEESLVSYLAGWVARKCGICAKCQDVLSKQLGDHSYCCRQTDLFANCKRFLGTASVGLVEPCDELIAAVHVMEQLFRVHYTAKLGQPNIASALFNIIQPHCDFQFLFVRHPEHALYLSQKLTKVYIVLRLFYAVKFSNRDLKQQTNATCDSVRRSTARRKMQKIVHS